MASVARSLLDLVLFGVFALLFLGVVYLFASYRLCRARANGEKRGYVAHADPWLPVVIVLTGASLLGLLRLIK